MGCACKTIQEYSYIQKKYGVGEKPKREETHIVDICKKMGLTLLLWVIMIPFIPFVIIYSLFHINKPIQISKFFRFKNE